MPVSQGSKTSRAIEVQAIGAHRGSSHRSPEGFEAIGVQAIGAATEVQVIGLHKCLLHSVCGCDAAVVDQFCAAAGFDHSCVAAGAG